MRIGIGMCCRNTRSARGSCAAPRPSVFRSLLHSPFHSLGMGTRLHFTVGFGHLHNVWPGYGCRVQLGADSCSTHDLCVKISATHTALLHYPHAGERGHDKTLIEVTIRGLRLVSAYNKGKETHLYILTTHLRRTRFVPSPGSYRMPV